MPTTGLRKRARLDMSTCASIVKTEPWWPSSVTDQVLITVSTMEGIPLDARYDNWNDDGHS